jgi:hypothetical protein
MKSRCRRSASASARAALLVAAVLCLAPATASSNPTSTSAVTNTNYTDVASLDCLVFPIVTANGTFHNATQLAGPYPGASLLPACVPPLPPTPPPTPPAPRSHGDNGSMCLKRFNMELMPPRDTVYTNNTFVELPLGTNGTVGAYDPLKDVNDTSCPSPPYAMCVTDNTVFNETWNLDSGYQSWEDGLPGMPSFDSEELPDDGGTFQYSPRQRGTGKVLSVAFSVFPTQVRTSASH